MWRSACTLPQIRFKKPKGWPLLFRVQSSAILAVATIVQTAGLAFEIYIQNLCVMAGRKQVRFDKRFF